MKKKEGAAAERALRVLSAIFSGVAKRERVALEQLILPPAPLLPRPVRQAKTTAAE